MGQKQLLWLTIAAVLVEMSIQITAKSGAEVLQSKIAKRDFQLCGIDLQRQIRFICGDSDWKRRSLQAESYPQVPGSRNAGQMAGKEGLKNVKFQSAPAPEVNGLHDDHEQLSEPTSGNSQELKKHIFTAVDGAAQQRPDSVVGTSQIGSDFSQDKQPIKKSQTYQEMADKCCNEGCTDQDIRQVFCPA
ncbi:prorelaxin H1-like [Varanus komodoensis]|uniref:prorelaxin H1-like n=1 Tax=Varanus komodoensis TaxID=61221 RepID=UPI001CF775F5|nr:prorelaxin H1-like [Varanus komodoensis]